MQCKAKLKPTFQETPGFIFRKLWKRRNVIGYGGTMNTGKVIYEININLLNLVKLRRSWLREIPAQFPQLVLYLKGYKTDIRYQLVR